MLYATASTAFIFLLIGTRKYRNVFNPYSAFNALWMLVCVLLIVGNEHVYEPNTIAKASVLIGVLAFNLSIICPKLVLGKLNNRGLRSYELNQRRLRILAVIVLALSFITALYSVKSLLSGATFTKIREDYYAYDSNSSALMYYLRIYIVSPLRYVAIVGTIITVFKEKNNDKLVLICTMGTVILQAITSGGRYVLMNTFFMFLCGYFLFGANKTISRKQKSLLIIVSIVLVYGLIYLTNDRVTFLSQNMTTSQRLYWTVYQYFCGSVTYLGKVIEAYPFVVGNTVGLNFLAGFITPFFVILTFAHMLPYPTVFGIIGEYACAVLRIGVDSYYNAMPTIFGYFLIDGGLAFVFIESWLFGYVCKRFYENYEKGSLLFTALYLLLFVQICTSSTRWFFYSSDYCLAFLYMVLILKRSDKKSREQVRVQY